MNFIETIRTAIDRHQLIPDGTNVVLGVSGGADSVALLHAFRDLNIPCTVAHLNHGLRGTESDADEQFVRNLGFPVTIKTVDVQNLAAENNLSIEMAARQARHDFFGEFENSVIVLAHHADDQAETFILKLARGAGLDGLSGMAPFQNLNGLSIVRPMLEIPRSDILRWLKENHISWREDASNTDETFLRNRVRHTILPSLKNELNPTIQQAILRTMDILREENAWMESLLVGTSLQDLLKMPLAAKRRALRNWIFEHGVDAVEFDAVEKILSLMAASEGTTIFELNNKQRIVIEYGIPRFEDDSSRPPEPEWTLSLEAGHGWLQDHGKGAGILPAEASFDADKVDGAPIEVRKYKPGDRMAPLGMDGSRKLQDILTDQKIPRARRNQTPVVVCRNEIIWLPGYRIARGWQVKETIGKAIHVRIEQNLQN